MEYIYHMFECFAARNSQGNWFVICDRILENHPYGRA